MWSRSEGVRRWLAAGLFTAAMGVSAVVYKGITPLAGFGATPPEVSEPVDRAVARLSTAVRPLEQVTACLSLKGYLADHLPPTVDVPLADAPRRPVILCLEGAADSPAAASRALREGLGWVRGIDGQRVIAYAQDEAAFQRAMAQAGVRIPPQALRPLSPMLAALQSNTPGVRREVGGGWRVPAHGDDGLVVYGPYLDLPPGAYRLTMHATLKGSPAQCKAGAPAFRPTLAVTRDAGTGEVRPVRPMAVAAEPGDPCALSLSDAFTLGVDGARKVETPLRAPSSLPFVIDGYALEPAAAAAQSR